MSARFIMTKSVGERENGWVIVFDYSNGGGSVGCSRLGSWRVNEDSRALLNVSRTSAFWPSHTESVDCGCFVGDAGQRKSRLCGRRTKENCGKIQ